MAARYQQLMTSSFGVHNNKRRHRFIPRDASKHDGSGGPVEHQPTQRFYVRASHLASETERLDWDRHILPLARRLREARECPQQGTSPVLANVVPSHQKADGSGFAADQTAPPQRIVTAVDSVGIHDDPSGCAAADPIFDSPLLAACLTRAATLPRATVLAWMRDCGAEPFVESREAARACYSLSHYTSLPPQVTLDYWRLHGVDSESLRRLLQNECLPEHAWCAAQHLGHRVPASAVVVVGGAAPSGYSVSAPHAATAARLAETAAQKMQWAESSADPLVSACDARETTAVSPHDATVPRQRIHFVSDGYLRSIPAPQNRLGRREFAAVLRFRGLDVLPRAHVGGYVQMVPVVRRPVFELVHGPASPEEGDGDYAVGPRAYRSLPAAFLLQTRANHAALVGMSPEQRSAYETSLFAPERMPDIGFALCADLG